MDTPTDDPDEALPGFRTCPDSQTNRENPFNLAHQSELLGYECRAAH